MAETKKNAAAYQGFVRTEEAPLLPPPPSETGITGWLWQNVVSSCADFTSVGASIRSLLMAAFTVFVAWLTVSITWSLVDFAFLSAVWSDPEGIKREACWTEEQGGALPNGWHGACWPFITTKMKFFIYGPYESTELWRVNLTGLIGLVGLVWVLIERLPYRRHMGVFLLTGYPLIAIVLLTGGAFEVSYGSLSLTALIGLGLISIGRLSRRELLGDSMTTFAGVFGVVGWLLVVYAGIMLVLSADVGLEAIDTNDWGGLLITLVVAVTGIVASLPLGIVLALGRRSNMPVARILSVVFIEFWRGVPLITVLFMASVMLPLFLPEGVNFNNLLRALIGVMLFSAAYMAEVVRGGLQAVDKGQYEGADAVGLSYWQKMRLIVLPQALTHVIPGIVNTFIGLFKDTTLVSIIGLFDLLGAAQSTLADAAWASPVQGHTAYLFIAVVFFVFCFGMSRYSIFMENKLSRGRRH